MERRRRVLKPSSGMGEPREGGGVEEGETWILGRGRGAKRRVEGRKVVSYVGRRCAAYCRSILPVAGLVEGRREVRELPLPPEAHVKVVVAPALNELYDPVDDLPKHEVNLELLLLGYLHAHVERSTKGTKEMTLELELSRE